MITCNTSLNICVKIELIPSVLIDHIGIKMEFNTRRNEKLPNIGEIIVHASIR